jgi:hypothetical protein
LLLRLTMLTTGFMPARTAIGRSITGDALEHLYSLWQALGVGLHSGQH